MALDDVPPHDMFLFGSSPDPLDAALGGASDDPAVDALVRDIRSAYLTEGTRPRPSALAAFAGPADGVAVGTVRSGPAAARVVEAPVPIGRRAAVAAAAFAATVTGKVVLGGAVAAAAIGGLHATETVDVPLLPRSPQAQTVPSTVPDLPDAASDPFRVLVPLPAQPPTDAVERTPAPDVPARGAPAPVAPQSDRQPSTADDPADVGEGRSGPGTPPATTPPPSTPPSDPPASDDPPAPTAGQPAGRAPEDAPNDTVGGAPSEADPGAAPPAGADRTTPTPPPDDEKISARS